ncbi:reverse transcriptase domain-containing protein [Tanacetum coccineum]
MAEEDEENTAFYNNQEVFCYTKMSFGLKNVRATYQRLVDKAFEKQINRNLEVYIDDLVIKSYIEHEILTDIEDTFRNLRRINMKLNPKKCTFGAEEGAFLVHVVSMKGIKPEKRPRTSIHGQVLVDLIAERPDEGGPPMEAQAKEETKSRNLYGTTSCANLDCQEKSYPTNERSSETTHSETGAKSSTSSKAKNDEGLLLNLDILKERKEKTAICKAKIKAKMEKYYNTKVRSTTFHPGDFVYRSNEASHAKESEKLGPKWEGLYEVVEALRKGAYKLRNGSGDILPRTWNVKDLKMLSLNFHHVSILDNVKPH